VRLKPSIEPSKEHSFADVADARWRAAVDEGTTNSHKIPSTQLRTSGAERLKAFQAKQEAIEVTQNRIAQRLGGWDMLMQITDSELERITALERRGQLSDEKLNEAVLRSRSVQAR
jgi:hypothetical protein